MQLNTAGVARRGAPEEIFPTVATKLQSALSTKARLMPNPYHFRCQATNFFYSLKPSRPPPVSLFSGMACRDSFNIIFRIFKIWIQLKSHVLTDVLYWGFQSHCHFTVYFTSGLTEEWIITRCSQLLHSKVVCACSGTQAANS